MEYILTKTTQKIPKVYSEWIDDCQVEAIKLESVEIYYLSMTYELQKAGSKRIDTGKVMCVNYCGERKLMSLYKLEKVN